MLDLAEFPEGSCDPILSSTTLDMQTTLFRHMMKEQASKVMKKPIDVSSFTRLWRSVDANSYLRHVLSEWLIVAKIAVVIVLGSVQDERTFGMVSFMKNRLRNRLSTNLGLVVRFKSQRFFSLDTFPYDSAYKSWRDEVKR
jgi:hypothetical protein